MESSRSQNKDKRALQKKVRTSHSNNSSTYGVLFERGPNRDVIFDVGDHEWNGLGTIFYCTFCLFPYLSHDNKRKHHLKQLPEWPIWSSVNIFVDGRLQQRVQYLVTKFAEHVSDQSSHP